MNCETASRENYEPKTITDAKPGSNALSSNQDMYAARNLFAQPKLDSTEPPFIDFGNVQSLYENTKSSDRILIAKSEDQAERPKETDQSFVPPVSQEKITSVAEKLGHDPHRWESRTTGKCNVYLDAVMQGCGMPRPWTETGILSCEKLDQMLANDSRYECPWKTDYSSDSAYQTAYSNWAYFKPQAGDILIWATNMAVHAAIADGNGNVYYAGARDPRKHGFGHTKIENFTGTAPANETNYGPPTSVYRYENLEP